MIIWDDVYVIVWRDATGGAFWEDPQDVLDCKPITVVDTGFVVEETDDYIKISPCIAFDGDEVHKFARWIVIPKGCIENVHRVPLKHQKKVKGYAKR